MEHPSNNFGQGPKDAQTKPVRLGYATSPQTSPFLENWSLQFDPQVSSFTFHPCSASKGSVVRSPGYGGNGGLCCQGIYGD